MPIYEYECSGCGFVTEVLHRMSECPEVVCGKCGGAETARIMSSCSFREGTPQSFRREHDEAKRIVNMRHELQEDYGVRGINMVSNSAGKTYQDIYHDIKSQGQGVPEAMQERTEANRKAVKEKQRDWMRGAMARLPKKRRERENQRRKEGRSLSTAEK